MRRTPRQILRALGPAVARPAWREILRSALGASLGIAVCAGLGRVVRAEWPAADLPLLVAPLGASAFLIFCVPNSPLAQPWSAIVGNALSALVAIAVTLSVPAMPLAVALSVGLSVLAMMLARAMHPPGAAVALLVALSPAVAERWGFSFALMPVAADTAVLVLCGVLYNRGTGRKYPFRQPPVESSHGTRDTAPDRRLGLSADDLGRILRDMNLAANIGPEDLARLIGVAEAEAAARHIGGLTAADLMSRDVLMVAHDAHPLAIAELFRARRFKTMPVVGADGGYLGLLSQADLMGLADERVEAEQIMATDMQAVEPGTPVSQLLLLLADGRQQAVPVIEGGRLVGLVTRSDMIGALAQTFAR